MAPDTLTNSEDFAAEDGQCSSTDRTLTLRLDRLINEIINAKHSCPVWQDVANKFRLRVNFPCGPHIKQQHMCCTKCELLSPKRQWKKHTACPLFFRK